LLHGQFEGCFGVLVEESTVLLWDCSLVGVMACEWPQVPSSVDLESYFVFTLHASQTLLLTEWTQREVLANHHPVLWYHFS